MKNFWQTIYDRWRNHMPVFFKRLMWLGGLMSGTAIAVHEVFSHYDIVADDWWLFIERYLIGGGAGIVFACKFTQTYGKNGEPIRKDVRGRDVRGQVPGRKQTRGNAPARDLSPDIRDLSPDIPNNCDMVAEQPSDKN